MSQFKMCQVDSRWLVSASAQIFVLCFLGLLLELPGSANGQRSSRAVQAGTQNYFLGPLTETRSNGHSCSGDVLVVTSSSVMIADFTYDGARGSRFYLFKGAVPSKGIEDSLEIPQVDGSREDLRAHNKETIVLGLRFMVPVPDLQDFDGLVVWNDLDGAVFAYIMFPLTIDVPKFDPWEITKPSWPLLTVDQVERSLQLGRGKSENLDELIDAEATGHHCYTTGPVLALTVQALALVGFTYDGTAPKAYFYLHRGPLPKKGDLLDPNNTVQIPDEFGSHGVLSKYTNEFVLLGISSVKLTDFDALIVWCDLAKVLFGYVLFPDDWELPPHERRIVVEGRRR